MPAAGVVLDAMDEVLGPVEARKLVEAGVVESAVLTIPATLPGPLWVTLLDWKLGLGGKMCVDPYVLQPVLPSE